MRNYAKPGHSSSRFTYWNATLRAPGGLLNTARTPRILSESDGCRPFLRNTRKLTRLAVWTSPVLQKTEEKEKEKGQSSWSTLRTRNRHRVKGDTPTRLQNNNHPVNTAAYR